MDELTSPDAQLIQRLLETMENDILPLTEREVVKGNKIFGAALLRKSDKSTYLAETNNEIESPLHHGEMHLLKRYFEIPAQQRTPVSDLLFFSTHEPCSMCLSAITWSGFDNFYYFFSHKESRDAFAIPHDLKILKEVFTLDPGDYNRQNAFWQCHDIQLWIRESAPASVRDKLLATVDTIKARYDAASDAYQSDKAGNSIPLN